VLPHEASTLHTQLLKGVGNHAIPRARTSRSNKDSRPLFFFHHKKQIWVCPSKTVSAGAYFRYHQHQPSLTRVWARHSRPAMGAREAAAAGHSPRERRDPHRALRQRANQARAEISL